jgi:riboflavin kinase/FMN adenylyltransferase
VTNIGTRPTVVTDGRPTIETHVLDLDRDLYGVPLRLAFVQRLRDERAFPDLEALRGQIGADCERARDLFRSISL